MTDFCVVTGELRGGELRDGDRLFTFTVADLREWDRRWPDHLRRAIALTEADLRFCQ